MSLHDDIVRAIEETGVIAREDIRDDTSLIRSGLLDSTALFEMAIWVEERLGHGLDLTKFDLADEWDTPAKLRAFIERHSRDQHSTQP